MKKICLVAVDVRSTHNVGSLLRTADGLSSRVILSGITPYPKIPNDSRLPHIAEKLHRQIQKTALGAENTTDWEYISEPKEALRLLRSQGYTLIALEQTPHSANLATFTSAASIALIVGEEVNGLSKDIISLCDLAVEIPMSGQKESFNVSVAAGISLYHFRYHS